MFTNLLKLTSKIVQTLIETLHLSIMYPSKKCSCVFYFKAPNKDRSEVLEESSYIILDQGAAKLHVGHQTLRINRPAKNQML